jgi:anhydro-N-acetylmuramic acid kinase
MQLPISSRPVPILGMMSGTSLDGVDCALCEAGDRRIRLIRWWPTPFPAPLKRRLHDAARNASSSHEVGQLHHDLGRFYAEAARNGLGQETVVAVGLHGQTIYHQPGAKTAATFQIGEPAWLAETLRVPVVCNFRAGDLAAGGQGAPLATLFHQRVFAQPGKRVCVNNLGGISNVTLLDDASRLGGPLLAFDTGPANVLLDLAMRELTHGRLSFDRNGAWAARGRSNDALVRLWLRHPYFRREPPKSTGREVFGERFWEKIQPDIAAGRLNRYDLLATLTEFTARSIALSYRLHLPQPVDRIILAGGGVSNPILVRRLFAALQAEGIRGQFESAEDLGWPTQAIEPAAFALLAHHRLRGCPSNLPETTGAARRVVLGQCVFP